MKNRVILVPFPFDDLSTAKVRPAVCLTDAIGPHRHVIVAFLSSQIPGDLLETDLVIDSRSEGFHATGLRVTSTLRLHRMMTITTRMILRELGAMPKELDKEVAKRIKTLFGVA